jgi:hypothetical protein
MENPRPGAHTCRNNYDGAGTMDMQAWARQQVAVCVARHLMARLMRLGRRDNRTAAP